MNVNDFFSSNSYVFLPTKNNPKVALTIDNKVVIKNSFDLYNPFSTKAKLLKIFLHFGFKYFNSFFKFIFRVNQKQQSPILKYLEKKLNQNLISSVYFATTNDKVVIQLQTNHAEVVGYLKFPLNEIGIKQIRNEMRALEVLSSNNIVAPYLLADQFNGIPFFLLQDLGNNIGIHNPKFIFELACKFKRNERYILLHHPRIKSLLHELHNMGLNELHDKLTNICLNSTCEYLLVYEHGDFAPWNVVNFEGRLIPFDFEYFVNDGLESLDLIKYFYQTGTLLKNKKGVDLILFIQNQLNLGEFKYFLTIFLIKEIHLKKNLKQDFKIENDLLNILDIR